MVERGRLGMWIFLVSDAMSFAALFIAYAVLHARAATWTPPHANLVVAGAATVALLASSPLVSRGKILPTIALGVLFLAVQAVEWRALLGGDGRGILSHPAGGAFFAITGWHGLHVVAGLIALAVARRRPSLPSAALFWQLVDGLWIVIVALLYVVPRLPGAAAWAIGFASLCGFALVVAWPMNLRGESRAVKVIFVLPLVLPALFAVALVADAAAPGLRP